MDSLFFDVLGAAIGFVTVMLLLSLIVTALVQATQSVLRLRARNLLFGLTAILQQEGEKSRQDAKDGARTILNQAVLRGNVDPTTNLGKSLGPQVSWLKPEQLKEILAQCPLNLKPDVTKKIEERFGKIQEAMRKRFLRNMRVWTIVWALPVAFYFQVSAPLLLSDFLNNPELRAQALQMAPDIQTRAQATLGAQVTYQQLSAKALEELAKKHPDLRPTLEEASGAGRNKDSIIGELALVLDDRPQKAALLAEYEGLLDAHYRAQLDAAREAIGAYREQLGQLGIEPWGGTWAFYVKDSVPQWGNWIGVLMTMILLSFGAPFWFNALRYFMNLRDTLKPPSKGQKTKPPSAASSGA
jgi:hypothetical protein